MGSNKVTVWTTTALVIANMVGTGVFTSLGFQSGALPSVPVLMLLWLVGGLLALCGGLAYIELSRLYPGSGGEYHFVKQRYGAWLAELVRIISVFAGFAAPVALSALAFAVYASQVFPAINVSVCAWLVLTLITAVHCFTIELGSRFQMISTVLKILLIVVFIAVGLLHPTNLLSAGNLWPSTSLTFSPAFASSLVYVSFAYSGWNASVYIYNELKQPVKNIRKSIIIGTLTVTAMYLLINLVFLKVVPLSETVGVIEIGSLAATRIFGLAGGKLISAMIGLLLISSMSAMVWVGARVIRPRATSVPRSGILLQYIITTVLLLSGTFNGILAYSSIALNISACLAVSILIVNRQTRRVAVIIPALIFLIATLWSSYYLLIL